MEVFLIVSYSLAYCIFYKISFSTHSTALIGQFVSDVAWGELDVLLVDTPPGTSDEHLAVLENMKKHSKVDGAILVTTPQVTTVLDTKKIPAVLNRNWQIRFPQISLFFLVYWLQAVSTGDVRREITFCKKTGVKILGVIENMSGFVCPHCSVRKLYYWM